jgi:hypothetical protein
VEHGRCVAHGGLGAAAEALDEETACQQLVAPERIGDDIQRVIDEPDVGCLQLQEVGVHKPQQGDTAPLGVIGCLRGQRGRLLLCLIGAALQMGCLGGQEAGLEPTTSVDGGPRHPFGEGMVVAGPGSHRPGHHQLGAATTTDEAPPCQLQRVLSAPPADRLDHFGARTGKEPLPPNPDPHPHDIPIDGVGQPQLHPATVHATGDQTLAFKGVDRGCIGQLVQVGLSQRLAHREQLQHVTLGAGELTQPQRHQLDQPVGGLQGAGKTPQASLLHQSPRLQRPGHQLPQKQRIPPAAIHQLPHARRHRPAQHRD